MNKFSAVMLGMLTLYTLTNAQTISDTTKSKENIKKTENKLSFIPPTSIENEINSSFKDLSEKYGMKEFVEKYRKSVSGETNKEEIDSLLDVINSKPSTPYNDFLKGELLKLNYQSDEAQTMFEKSYEGGFNHYLLLIELADFKLSELQDLRPIKSDHYELDAKKYRTNTFIEANEAIKLYDNAIRQNPDFRKAYYHKAEVLSLQGRYDEANLVFVQLFNMKKPGVMDYIHFSFLLQDMIRYGDFNPEQKNDLSVKFYENEFEVYKFTPNDLSLELFQDAIKQDTNLTNSQKNYFLEKSHLNK